MKTQILFIALLLVLTVTIHADDSKIITCTVVEVNKSISCEGRLRTITDKEPWEEWALEAPMANGGVHPDGKLSQRQLVKGDSVKVMFTDGELKPVADCNVRVYRNKKKWLEGRSGERMPAALDTQPDDCQPWYGKNE